jgi:hypothetical protein
MPRISKTTKRNRARDAIRGLKSRFGPNDITRLGGKAMTRNEAIAFFQSHLDAIAAVDAATAALRVAVARERALDRQVLAFMPVLQSLVESRFERYPGAWGEFGLKLPKKPGPKTVKAKAEGARKAALTLAARGTTRRRRRR